MRRRARQDRGANPRGAPVGEDQGPEESPDELEPPEEEGSEEAGAVSIVGALRGVLSRSARQKDEAPAGSAEPEGGGFLAEDPGARDRGGEDATARRGWLRRKLALRQSLRVQIAAGFGTAILLTLLASLVALVVFFQVRTLQREINTEHVPALTRAVRIGQLAAHLAGTAPRLVAAARNRQLAADPGAADAPALETAGLSLMEDAANIIELSEELGTGERARELGAFSEDLAGNLRDIQVSVETGVTLQEALARIQERATVRSRELNEIVGPPLDDQVFYMATGLRELDDEPAPVSVRGSEDEVLRFQALNVLDSRGNLAISLLTDVAVQDDLELVETLEERFRAATASAARALAALGDRAPAGLEETLDAVYRLGLGEEGVFPIRRRYLAELRNQLAYLARNESITDSLEMAVASLTVGLEVDALAATRDSEAAFDLGQSLLVALDVAGISIAALILWLFVGRFLVARLTNLSRAMRRMADGNLETRIEVRGRDEVGEMAQALEVFRRHALEVQRLNLVEQLATRVEAQNKELASTLEDLRKAQDQMVIQEKLASLGQLTAGIAHEIKNPLNFVNNFAEVSTSLLDDLQEELDTVIEMIPDDLKEEIADIRKDLSGNLERIVHHGKRASSIVYGMLEHARKEGGERRPTEINAMLDEYIALAFHSMRAVDGRFQMTIHKDLAENVGAVEAVPQDLSRVFLNIVTNACQATFEKQLSGGTDPGYEPALDVRSRRENGKIEVRIQDNGPGIPKSHLDRIFEPFFTTKGTEKGTGLGLSLSHDIIRGHGGSLVVHSEAGEGAEFVITLPDHPPALPGAGEANGGSLTGRGHERQARGRGIRPEPAARVRSGRR